MTEIPDSADQKLVNAIVDALDPITLWRWKKAIDEREERAHGGRTLTPRDATTQDT